MNIDLLLWVIRATIIIIGIITAIIVWKGKKRGRYQELSFRFFAIGIPIFIIGVILLIVSFITAPLFDYGLFLTVAGSIAIIVGLIIRNIWEKSR